MNLKTHIKDQRWQRNDWQGNHPAKSSSHSSPECFRGSLANSAVALVITLLMLSVITFLAIAFLAMTKRDRSAVTATLDVDTAKNMSDAALARAQTEIIAQMMAQTDILSYDYTASHNYITPSNLFYAWFSPTSENSNAVNYDYLGGLTTANAQNWAQNIGNLFFDPRPPVFVMTNGNLAQPTNDFRFWVDINRNGRFETNGYQSALYPNGQPVPNVTNFNNGEPEWIGVLKYPEYAHSPTNSFIGRYAFMALPIGKTLDLNFIHNYSKYLINSGGTKSMTSDAFVRDEGVGSWELNLAAFLEALSPAMYQTNSLLPNPYYYNVPPAVNTGGAFDDASQILGFRYGHNMTFPNVNYPFSLNYMLGSPLSSELFGIDEYGTSPATSYPFDFTGNPTSPSSPWPGTYNSNMFYDVQDLFDPNKTGLYGATKSGLNFTARLASAMTNQDSYNRYTFQRLLACIGTSSAPEYGVYVYSNLYTNLPLVPPPSWLRTKVNINYDNTAQIQAGPYSQTAAGLYGPYTPMPTNLTNWTPLGFFTNAADLLLRSQVFVYTNYLTTSLGQYVTNGLGQYVQAYAPTNWIYMTFGITNIPVFMSNSPGVCYNEQVHRMLQLAANIYSAANPLYSAGTGAHRYQQPSVFRPLFNVVNPGTTNAVLNIVGYTNVTAAGAYNQLFYNPDPNPWKDATNALLTGAQGIQTNDNVWGVPWVVGAVKGIPAFDQYNYQSRVFYQRQLQFVRKPDPNNQGKYLTTLPLQATNQFYQMSVSNYSGMDAWNPYSSNFYGSGNGLYIVASNYITVTITNNYRFRFTTNLSLQTPPNFIISAWPGYPQTGAFQTFLLTNFVTLPFSYFSESSNGFVAQAGNPQSWLPQDTNQTTYPTHYWAVSVTNHLYYVLFDGNPASGTANVLDFVNLGPFGRSFPITLYLQTNSQPSDPFSFPRLGGIPSSNTSWWWVPPATDAGTAQLPVGAVNQINWGENNNIQFYDSITGTGTQGFPASQQSFYPPPIYIESTQLIGPTAQYSDSNSWIACDPLVHYTLGDLIYPGYTLEAPERVSASPTILPAWTSGLGSVTTRYSSGIANNNIVFGDPGLGSPNYWQFPTNLFPGVGWLGRVHRGTPWQTVYLKCDASPASQSQSYQNWYTTWVNSPFTYPTNDWSLIDLFTAVPNDNAARGLLSVNQTNDAAWAAVFAGVIASTSITTGVPIDPTNDISYLMETNNGITNGINVVRALQTNQIFPPYRRHLAGICINC